MHPESSSTGVGDADGESARRTHFRIDALNATERGVINWVRLLKINPAVYECIAASF